MGMQTGAANVESSTDIPQKLKIDLPFDPVIPLLGIYPMEPKTLIQKNIIIPMFIAALFSHQDMEAAPVSISRRVDKTTVEHLHNGILLGCKKEENFTLFNNMDGPGEY